MDKTITLSVVASVYNEEKNIGEFYSQVSEIAEKLIKEGNSFEVIFVDDGSTDDSYKQIAEIKKSSEYVKILRLSRNFGHEAAMLAGIDKAKGAAIICMDSDLQHPPECIFDMLAAYNAGYDIVNMVRDGYGKKISITKRVMSFLFYKLINFIAAVKIEESASDFFLVSNRAAHVLRNEYREQSRFLRGFIQIMGFKKTVLKFKINKRFGGESKYSIKKLFSLSKSAIISFSNVPLRAGILAGGITGLIGIGVAVYSLVVKLSRGAPPGYTTIVILLCVLFSINFFVLGVIGEYIGHMLYEVKKRPLYIIDEFIE